ADALRASGVGAHVTNQDLLVFGENGLVDNELRYFDECARHKTLDMIGDLSLVGADLIGRFTSSRGGHILNGLMAQNLHERMVRSNKSLEQADGGSATQDSSSAQPRRKYA
ncbi:MAG: UDP-3-O-acyl-N-acetylglucosamine deacetylase, partial [Planctomycetota bacterium]